MRSHEVTANVSRRRQRPERTRCANRIEENKNTGTSITALARDGIVFLCSFDRPQASERRLKKQEEEMQVREVR